MGVSINTALKHLSVSDQAVQNQHEQFSTEQLNKISIPRMISKLQVKLGADANLRNAAESEFLSCEELMLQSQFIFARGQEDRTVYFRNTK